MELRLFDTMASSLDCVSQNGVSGNVFIMMIVAVGI